MENKNTSRVVIGVLVVLVLLLGGYIAVSGGKSAATANGASEAAALPMETYQAQYVKPETPIDRSKNVTLPGWGGFTIPAKTKKITQGFEFHNPAENLWYEDWVSLDGTTLEKLVVDSGQTTELSHYLRLAGIQAEVTKVLDADPAYFEIQKTDAGAYTIEAVKGYKGEKTLTVQTDDGKQYTLTLTGKEECYYIAFGLYLEDGDELLPAAVEVVLETGQASVSMLQRRLKLGYSRAARLVDQMEERGYVGPFEGSKPRQLLITREKWQELQMARGIAPAETPSAPDRCGSIHDVFESHDALD